MSDKISSMLHVYKVDNGFIVDFSGHTDNGWKNLKTVHESSIAAELEFNLHVEQMRKIFVPKMAPLPPDREG